jgi:hypothetical protein
MFTLDPIRKPFQTFNSFNRVATFKSFQGAGLGGYSSVKNKFSASVCNSHSPRSLLENRSFPD